MLKGCALFHPAWLLQTILLWPLAPLVLHRLTFFAMMEDTPLEQIKVRATIHMFHVQSRQFCLIAPPGLVF
jgi:hypothetical protein